MIRASSRARNSSARADVAFAVGSATAPDEATTVVDLYKLAGNLIVDDVVEPDRLREQLIARFQAYQTRREPPFDRKHGVPPV